MAGDKIGEVEIEFPDGDVDVIGVDAEARLSTFRSLLQPFPVRRLQRNCLEQDHHYQVQPPYLPTQTMELPFIGQPGRSNGSLTNFTEDRCPWCMIA